ncbi:MAG TPA: protein phosphatase 2C domain-containing protein, partial [Pyrinomonadaceae bacterium]|nr:protein phosphatase 2C domain-containing protein [Pyrinomonadaceae bacterium]
RISSAAISERGLSEKRPQNEDSFLEMPPCGIYAVADGVGGAQAGEVASQMAVEILGEAFSNLSPSSDAETAMRAAMEQANSSIFQMAHELPQLATMATTIVALHLDGNIATIGHVGDSRLYRVDRNGNLFRETEDHSVVAEEVRAGRMTEEQADNHPSKNVISRALGAEGTVEPDLKTIMVEPGTSFLLCSDGITRHISDAEIKGVLTFGGDPNDVCEYLKNLVYERGAEDNLTAVVVKVAGTDQSVQTEEMPGLDTLETDEDTVATARTSPFDAATDDDDLLELNTGELPPLVSNEGLRPEVDEAPEPVALTAADPMNVSQAPTIEIESPQAQAAIAENFSMFGASDEAIGLENSSGIGTLGGLVAGLIIGAAIGLGVYYFVLAPKPTEPPVGGQLSEMRSANIPLSAFEENRRDVDKDPAAYITKFGSGPQDCEDHFLLGRAYLLTGDYIKARAAFTEARNRLADADPVNQKTLAADIATAFAVTNDTTVQSILKKELESTVAKPANANVTPNSNSAPVR